MVKFINPHEITRFENRGRVTFGHVSYEKLLANGIVNEQFDHRALKFAITRNPYERAYSLFKYLTVQNLTEGSFEKFLYDLCKEKPNLGLYNFRGLSMACPQCCWIYGNNDRQYANEIFHVENLTELEAYVREKFSYAGQLGIPHLNKTDRSNNLNEILSKNSSIVHMIQDYYEDDFVKFGYKALYS